MRVEAIVLGAGRSERMGQNKLLLPWGGRPVVRHVVEVCRAAGLGVLVVVGEAEAEIRVALEGTGGRVVVNREPDRGMASSIAEGVRAADANTEVLLVVLGDMPFLTTGLIATVLAESRPDRIVCPTCGTRRGNPVAFGSQFRAELEAVEGDKGARRVMERHIDALIEVPVEDEGTLEDLDTPEDYRKALERARNSEGPASPSR